MLFLAGCVWSCGIPAGSQTAWDVMYGFVIETLMIVYLGRE